jgi:hypothetical protein
MRDQNWRRGRSPYCLIQGLYPLITYRMIPITLYYAANLRVYRLPQRLPMARAGIPNAWHENSGTHVKICR